MHWGWTQVMVVMLLVGATEAWSEEVPPPVPVMDGGASRSGLAEPFLGVVIPHDSVDVASKFEGRLERLEVDVGASVRQGDVLARLDVRAMEQDLAAARAALLGSRAEEQAAAVALAEARETKSRYFTPRSLELGVYSEQELSTLRYQESTALARLGAARARTQEQLARVRELEQNVGEAVLVAPFDGVVASRPVSPGARVAPGEPILRLLGTGGRKVRFAVPEEKARQLEPGAPLQLSFPQPALTIGGHVESIAPEVDAAARMVFAIATFDTPPPETVTTGLVVKVQPGPTQGAVGQAESSGPIPTRGGQ